MRLAPPTIGTHTSSRANTHFYFAPHPIAVRNRGTGQSYRLIDEATRRAIAAARWEALDGDVPADVGDDVLSSGLSLVAPFLAPQDVRAPAAGSGV
jgi:hypothetical protein